MFLLVRFSREQDQKLLTIAADSMEEGVHLVDFPVECHADVEHVLGKQ